MDMDRLIRTSLFCLFVKGFYVFGDTCGNGAHCIRLTDCKVLQNGVLNGERSFRSLLRQLHCGFKDDKVMVCCPPEFLSSQPANTDQGINPSAVNLLPDASVCGYHNTDRIFGGIRTQFDDHPWLALIRYDKPTGRHGYYCGGVLISSRYVLTAAHCVKGADIPPSWTVSQVRLGEWNTSSEVDCMFMECAPPVVDVDVEEIIPHSQYTSDDHQQHDIALLRLARDVSFSDFVRPVCLPSNPELRARKFEGEMTEIVGWGITENGFVSDIKLIGRLSVVNQSACHELYKKATRKITKKQLCAGSSEDNSACRGDSGGPLLATSTFGLGVNWVVIGVKSYGPFPCGTRGWPAVYTRVSSYMDWIINNMRP